MNSWTLVFVLGMSAMGFANAAEGANPIRKIVTLLQNMQKEIEAEGAKEKELFDKFMCFCSGNKGDLTKKAADATAAIEELGAKLKSEEAEKVQVAQELIDHKKDRESAAAITEKDKERAAAVQALLEEKDLACKRFVGEPSPETVETQDDQASAQLDNCELEQNNARNANALKFCLIAIAVSGLIASLWQGFMVPSDIEGLTKIKCNNIKNLPSMLSTLKQVGIVELVDLQANDWDDITDACGKMGVALQPEWQINYKSLRHCMSSVTWSEWLVAHAVQFLTTTIAMFAAGIVAVLRKRLGPPGEQDPGA